MFSLCALVYCKHCVSSLGSQVSHEEAGEYMNTAEHQVDEMRKFLETYTPIEDAGGLGKADAAGCKKEA